jgi:hypothetical protein
MMPRRRRAPGQDSCNPGNDEAEHIGEVVPGVGDQRHRIGDHAVGELHRDKSQIEADADGEGHAEACGTVDMGVPVMVMNGVFMHAIAIKSLMWAHREHETSTRRVMIYASVPYMHPPRGHTAV